MYSGNRTRIIPIILIFLVIVVAIVALVSLGRVVFGGGTSTKVAVDEGRQALLNTDAGSSVRMTVRGRIVADENFRSYRITIDPSSRTLSTYSGYIDQVIDSIQLTNNTPAYEQFVHALDRANMMRGTQLSDEQNDTRGVCATGNVFEFEVLSGGETVKKLWTSSCDSSPGSLKAATSQLRSLFIAQIPNGQQALNKINL